MRPRPVGILLLSLFFAAGALVALLTCVALLGPGSRWEPVWRLNPPAHTALVGMGSLGIMVMAAVATACGSAAAGLWAGRRWGRRLAVGLLIVNLVGDTANALLRGDWWTLVGLPIGGLLLAYLLSGSVRRHFESVDGA